ncbi:MAG: PIG-L family deacetylase [Actinobacteria bacterium]|nr:PIG-L family deacetylase [Actinomycetota bacterium]
MWPLTTDRPRGVLALGAHPDDVEIGCGGTLLRLARRFPGLPVTVVVLTGTAQRQAEARTAAGLFLAGCRVDVRTSDLPDGRLPAAWDAVKDLLAAVAADVDVDLVLAPRPDDAHQDHRTVAEIAPTLWRDHLLLSYEIPKWDGDLGRPNVYVPLDEDTAHEKVRLLDKAYPSQAGRDWWDEETFLGLARIRGTECRARYAEAFHLSKAVLSW